MILINKFIIIFVFIFGLFFNLFKGNIYKFKLKYRIIHKNSNYSPCNFINASGLTTDSNILSLPFGSQIWNNYKFPVSFFEDSINMKKLGKAISYYDEINKKNEVLVKKRLPKFRKIEYFKIDSNNTKCNNGIYSDYLLEVKGSIYELPKVGRYKSYYVGINKTENLDSLFKKSCKRYSYYSYGYLLLSDTLTLDAKIINIYFFRGRDASSFGRYFFIDENYNISLFETICSDSDCRVKLKYKINISANGDIKSRVIN